MTIAYDNSNFDWYNFKEGNFDINRTFHEIHLPVKKADDGYYYQGIAYITPSHPRDGDDPEYDYVDIKVTYHFDWDGRYSASHGYYYDSQRYKKLYQISRDKGLPEVHFYRSKRAKKQATQTSINTPSIKKEQFSVDAEKMTATPIIDESFVKKFGSFLATWAGWMSTVGKTIVDAVKEGVTKEEAIRRAKAITPPANTEEMIKKMEIEAQRRAEARIKAQNAQAHANAEKYGGGEEMWKAVDNSKARPRRAPKVPKPPAVPKNGPKPYAIKGLTGASRALTGLAILGLGAEGVMVYLNYLEWQYEENGPAETFYKNEFELSLLGWGNSLVIFAGSVGVGMATAGTAAAAATTAAAVTASIAIAGIGSLWAILDLACYYATGDHLPVFIAKTVTHAAGAITNRATGGAVNEYGFNWDFSSWDLWWSVKFQ